MAITRRTRRAQETATHNAYPQHGLNIDVLLLVFDEVSLTDTLSTSVDSVQLFVSDKPALLSVARVCRQWNYAAQQVLDNTLGPLIFSTKCQSRVEHVLKRYNTSTGFRQRVKHIHIGEWHVYASDAHSVSVPVRKQRRVVPDHSPWRAGRYLSKSWDGAARKTDPTWSLIEALVRALGAGTVATFRYK